MKMPFTSEEHFRFLRYKMLFYTIGSNISHFIYKKLQIARYWPDNSWPIINVLFSISRKKISNLFPFFSVDNGAIELLCQLTHKYDPSLRLNGVWGLMNMAFQSDQRIKVQIITALGGKLHFYCNCCIF